MIIKKPRDLEKSHHECQKFDLYRKKSARDRKCLVLNLLKLRNFDQKLHLNLKNLTNQNPLKPTLYPQHPLIQVEDQDLDFRSLLNQSDLKLDYQQVTIVLYTKDHKLLISTLQK